MPANKIKYKLSNTYTSLLDLIYPVGALYISSINTSPASLFGGTWAQITDGAALRAANAYGLVGSDSITLTLSQIPGHTHTGPSHTHSINEVSTNWDGGHNHPVAVRKDSWLNNSGERIGNSDYWNQTIRPIPANTGQHSHTIPVHNTNKSGTGATGSSGGGGTFYYTALSQLLCMKENCLIQESEVI